MTTCKIAALNAVKPERDPEYHKDLEALYRGGKKLRERMARFLNKNPQEPTPTYEARVREGHYRNYLGQIIGFYGSYLFTSELVVRAKREGEDKDVDLDPWYGTFKQNCDSLTTDLSDFMRERAKEMLVHEHAWWVVEQPQAPADESGAPMVARDKAEYSKLGLDNLKLRAIPNEEVLDWDMDRDGRLLWVMTHTLERPRLTADVGRSLFRERWKWYGVDHVETWEIEYTEDKKPNPEDVISGTEEPHPFGGVPVVCMTAPSGLWMGDLLFLQCLEHLRISNSHSWGIKRSNYSLLVLNRENPEDAGPTTGQGYYLALGLNESAGFVAPPSDHLAVSAAEVTTEKDEIFRTATQMAMGVNNNAAAVGRSAQSKVQDSEATRVISAALAQSVREAVGRTYTLIGMGRGDAEVTWDVSGLSAFHDDPLESTETALSVKDLGVKSVTFKKELHKRVAKNVLRDTPQATKDVIFKEIDEGTTEADEGKSEIEAAWKAVQDEQGKRAQGGPGEGEPGAPGSPGGGGGRPPEPPQRRGGGKPGPVRSNPQQPKRPTPPAPGSPGG